MAIFCLLKNYIFDNSNLTRAHIAQLVEHFHGKEKAISSILIVGTIKIKYILNSKMISTKNFTVIIPCISYLDVKKCIKNIRKYYKKIKIIVCLNKIRSKKNKDKNLKIILTKSKSIGKKRNIAVDASKSKYLAFIDSDAYPAKNWIESTFKLINKKEIKIIAGPHIDPLKQNNSQRLIGAIKKSFLITMMPQLQKNTAEKKQFVSFLPSVNWITSKKFYNSMNQMDDKMLRNEDWDFVYRMKKKKARLLYSPKTLVYHENNTLIHFIKKRFNYGFYMWPILTKLNLNNYYFFLPLFFAIFLMSFPLIFIFDYYSLLYSIILIIYFLVTILEAIKLRLGNKSENFLSILFLLIVANVSPGFGIFLGFFNFLIKKV